jgi:hypothetical protein
MNAEQFIWTVVEVVLGIIIVGGIEAMTGLNII